MRERGVALQDEPSKLPETADTGANSPDKGLAADIRLDSLNVVATRPDDLLGKSIDKKIRIDALIAKGGMGAVYLGHHLVLDRLVAVKVLAREVDEQSLARFKKEAQLSLFGRSM